MESGKEESMHTYPLRSLASFLERGEISLLFHSKRD
ncbi:unnamed protein product [Brassica oleracea var. botrytis]